MNNNPTPVNTTPALRKAPHPMVMIAAVAVAGVHALIYFGLLLMSLFSTLLPALPGRHVHNEARSRYEVS